MINNVTDEFDSEIVRNKKMLRLLQEEVQLIDDKCKIVASLRAIEGRIDIIDKQLLELKK